jgi:hypothetical protein
MTLAGLIDAELQCPVAPSVAMLGQRLAVRAGTGSAAVLFYGSGLRDAALDGVLDFYVLLDRAADWPGSRLSVFANRVLPPNVGYLEEEIDGRVLRAKYAVMTLERFGRGMSVAALDTTLWSRFSQPCALVHVRSPADREAVGAAIRGAVITASKWAAALGPASGEALAYWKNLYARTYELELRVEKAGRGNVLLTPAADRYARLLPVAWREAGIAFGSEIDGRLQPRLSEAERAAALQRWRLRRRLGRPLNVLRLLKAAFTFERAIDYVAWKVERHSGVRLELAPWQRRFPLLAAPCLYWRLRRLGVLR